MNKILIKDQTIGGGDINTIELEFESQIITLRDLIMRRVEKEVAIYNQKMDEKYLGLVVPEKVEKLLNYKTADKRKVDGEKQTYVALDGFMKNQFFVIINDKQAEDLDQKIELAKVKQVEFIKLTPLVGG